jgi:hypothetical protein
MRGIRRSIAGGDLVAPSCSCRTSARPPLPEPGPGPRPGALDVDPIVALYAPDATFSTQPFRESFRGREGVRQSAMTRAFGEEKSLRAWVWQPIVDGDRVSISW